MEYFNTYGPLTDCIIILELYFPVFKMPGTRCTVATCSNSRLKTIKGDIIIMYHRFPQDKEMKAKWVHFTRRGGKWNPDTSHICSEHFTEDDYERDLQNELLGLPQRKRLKKSAFPHVNTGNAIIDENTMQSSVKRTARANKRRINKEVCQILSDSNLACVAESSSAAVEGTPVHEETNPEDLIRLLQSQLAEANTHLKDLKAQLTVTNSQLLEKNNEVEKLKSQLEVTECQKIHFMEKTQPLIELQKSLSTIFSQNQIEILSGKNRKWKKEDINQAFTLRYLGARAYTHLRNMNFPLPGETTLRSYAHKFAMHEGILHGSIDLMEIAGLHFEAVEKLTVLSFDEMKVSYVYEYEEKDDRVIGPHHNVQVAMARGLFRSWKQPVFMDFTQQMTDEILNSIITSLYSKGFSVVACVADCGGANRGLWNSLGLGDESTSFNHPTTGNPIFYFPDVPHLLKLTRNWLLDTGFILEDGSEVGKEPLEELLSMGSSEVRTTFKLTELHLTCDKSQRQSVRLAAQLLSNTTSTAVRRYCKHVKSNATANFIGLINQWYDIMNSYVPHEEWKESLPHVCAYGLNLDAQDEVLEEVKKVVTGMICPRKNKKKNEMPTLPQKQAKKPLLAFQKGIIMAVSSLQGLYRHIKVQYPDIRYILAHRLNQDCLQNLFGQLRMKGGLHDHPTPVEVKYRMRMLILGNNSMAVGRNTNMPNQSSDTFLIEPIINFSLSRSESPIPLINHQEP